MNNFPEKVPAEKNFDYSGNKTGAKPIKP